MTHTPRHAALSRPEHEPTLPLRALPPQDAALDAAAASGRPGSRFAVGEAVEYGYQAAPRVGTATAPAADEAPAPLFRRAIAEPAPDEPSNATWVPAGGASKVPVGSHVWAAEAPPEPVAARTIVMPIVLEPLPQPAPAASAPTGLGASRAPRTFPVADAPSTVVTAVPPPAEPSQRRPALPTAQGPRRASAAEPVERVWAPRDRGSAPARSAASPSHFARGTAPRRGQPSPRRRSRVPLVAATLTGVAAASVALVIFGLQLLSPGAGVSGLTATPAVVRPTETTTSSPPTPSPQPASVQTVYAEGAFAAPQTGGVKLIPSVQGPLSGKVIVVDPGHNGAYSHAINERSYYTYGAGYRPCVQAGTTTFNNITESTITWGIANKLVPLLLGKGATVVITRSTNTGYGPCNNERPEIANREGADLFLSIHVDGNNDTKLRGFHITWSPLMAGGNALSEKSRKAARIVYDHLLSSTNLPNSNYMQSNGESIISRTDLSVLDGVRGAPAILVETGNSRNPEDVALLTSDEGQLSLAMAFAAAAQEIIDTLPANTTIGASSPSPEAPSGAATPPDGAKMPAWTPVIMPSSETQPSSTAPGASTTSASSATPSASASGTSPSGTPTGG